MGTRHLIAVYNQGEYRVAQYGQWDGYPTGQGVDVLAFLSDPEKRDSLREKSLNTGWITTEAHKDLYAGLGIDPESEFISMADADKFKDAYPWLSRDCGSDILKYVADNETGKPILLKDSLSFAGDSLFCEWVYVVDFDKGVLEVYKGFNTSPVDPENRFANFKEEDSGEYHPVQLKESFSLDALPTKAEFVAALEPQDEE